MGGLVRHQLRLQEEALAALSALEGLSVCVHSLVGDEQGLVVEALLAMTALVRLGFQVALTMGFQAAAVREPFVAVVTLLRLLPGVGPLVGHQERLIVEFFITLVAVERFALSVNVAVSGKQSRLREALVAHRAGIGKFSSVDSLMGFQDGLVSEPFLAEVALMRLFIQQRAITGARVGAFGGCPARLWTF